MPFGLRGIGVGEGRYEAKQVDFILFFLVASIPPVIQSTTKIVESYEEDLYLAVEIGTRLEVIQGAKIDLVCRVTGFPTPNVNWVKGNSPLTVSFERQGFYIVPYNGTSTTLRIRGSQPPQEDEVYGCTAYNSGGSVTAFSYVTFKGALRSLRHQRMQLIFE